MTFNPFLGVFLHSIGGLAAASFYVPYRKVKGWAWESFWLAGGFFSWIIAPWVVALLTAPDTIAILRESPPSSLFWAFFFGLLWGVGGLTFGLSMRYLGIALGYAIALGFCAAFGTLMIPLYKKEFGQLLTSASGLSILAGVGICLAGIAVSGAAGRSKERELPEAEKQATIREFDFVKGLAVAIFAGVLSACMNYGIIAGEPIATAAVNHGTPDLWKNSPVFVVVLAGGFTTNFLWCVFLNLRNHTGSDYRNPATPLLPNYLFCALAGTTWYLQFMFYGMGTTKMGPYNFSSWSLHMASIIIFSTLWGIALHEWRGTSLRTHRLIATGLAVLIASMLVVGYGNYLKVGETPPKAAASVREARG
jgi:L-rhamnose-H+ transport protein